MQLHLQTPTQYHVDERKLDEERMDLKGKDSPQPSQYVRCCHMSLSMRLQLLLLLLTNMTPGQIAPVAKSGDNAPGQIK